MAKMAYFVLGLYFVVMLLLACFGLHRYQLVYLFARHRKQRPVRPPLPELMPALTVQLPVYNEKYVVERLVRSVVEMDYPRDRFSVQLLDDSTDETTEICARLVEEVKAQGIDIVHIHRTDRTGYKAGALEYGLKSAAGEFVAVFDADFVPPKSFLMDAVAHFADPKVGMVQGCWTYLNEDYSLLTTLQTMFLDGHFVVEHPARCWSGRFFNFNGTAGIWRKTAIADAGGWHHDTLTEDLDLSYRAQTKGWKFVYSIENRCPSELPVEMSAFKTQQHRWAKGSIETMRKLLVQIWKTPTLPTKVKLEASFHLAGNLGYLLMVLLALLTLPAMWFRIQMNWNHLAWVDAMVFLVSFVPVCLFYVFAQMQAGKTWGRRMLLVPFMLALGIGISVNNARAVWEGLRGKRSAFIRTPKYRVEKRGDLWMEKRYRVLRDSGLIFELFLTLYCGAGVVLAARYGLIGSIPFLMLFVLGYGYVALLTTWQLIAQSRQPLMETEPTVVGAEA